MARARFFTFHFFLSRSAGRGSVCDGKKGSSEIKRGIEIEIDIQSRSEVEIEVDREAVKRFNVEPEI